MSPSPHDQQMMPPDRVVILHYHIFKNAGSTLDSILVQTFGSQVMGLEGKAPWETLEAAHVSELLRKKPTLKVITSHQLRLPLPEVPNRIFLPIIFLRHPIDRVGSVYSFERNSSAGQQSPGVKVAHENDLAGYVKWRLRDPEGGAVIHNFQTVHLAGREKDMRFALGTASDLKTAMDRLAELRFFGLVERFTESIQRLKTYLAGYNINLVDSYSVRNKSRDRKSTLSERIEEIKAQLKPDLWAELLEKNSLDMKLYEFATELFKA